MANPILYLTVFQDGSLNWTTNPSGWDGTVDFWGGAPGSFTGTTPQLDPNYDVVIDYSNLRTLNTELELTSADWATASLQLNDPSGYPINNFTIDDNTQTLTIPANSGLPSTLYVELFTGSSGRHTFDTQITSSGSDSVYSANWMSYTPPTGPTPAEPPGENFETPIEEFLDTSSSGEMTDGADNAQSTYLDLTALTDGNDVFELEAEFGSWDYTDQEVGIVFVGDQYYEFKNIDGYVIDGLSDSETTEVIRVNTRSDANETLILGPGYGLEINLGAGVGSDSDVLVVEGGAINIDLNIDPATGDEYLAYTLTDGGSEVGAGVIRGVDVVIGSSVSTDGDVITGAISRANIIVGLDGNDEIYGGDQADFLVGGLGSDIIDGGAGDDVIIDLDADTLTGGEGRDIFVVRGSSDLAQSATITDLGISPDGLSFEGLDSQSYQDRIAFNFSSSALSTALVGILGEDYSISNPPSAVDYYQIAEGLELNIRSDSGDVDAPFVLEVIYDANGDGIIDSGDILGQVKFGVATEDLPGTDEVYKAVLLDAEDFTKNIEQAILDQIEYFSGDPIPAGDAPTNLPGDDSITLFVGVERQYKYTVFGSNEGAAEAKPVLVAYEEGGIQVATKFRPGNADETILGSSASDTYAHSAQVFVDPTTGEAATDQAFGRDTIVERGGDADKFSLEASITDLLVGDLTLERMERGSEGQGNSLRIRFNDVDTTETSELNIVDTIIYKQYVDYNSSFRVEGLEMVDPTSSGYNILLAEAVSETEMEAAGNVDSIFVGQAGVSEMFTIKAGTTDGSGPIDVYMTDFDSTQDQIEFEGYENVVAQHRSEAADLLSSDPTEYAEGFATVTATNTGTGHEVNFNIYFTEAQADDDWIYTAEV
ncbi:hypothetical protein N9L29_02825 [Litoricolaceae bacterium]|nr:hypothetical protein [Litorivicinaceae bacterium]